MTEHTPEHETRPAEGPSWDEQLAMLSDVGRVTMSCSEAQELLKGVADAVHHGFAYYDVSIFLIDEEGGECVLLARAGDRDEPMRHGYRQKIGVGMVGWVAEHGESLLANDVEKEPRRIVAFDIERNCRSEVAVPIQLRGKTIGVINVEHIQPNAFQRRDVVALETIADQLAQAIENAQLYQRSRMFGEFHRRVLDSIPSGICVMDRERRAISVNVPFANLFGSSVEEMTGKCVGEFLPPLVAERTDLANAVATVCDDGASLRWRNLWEEPEGRCFNVRLDRARLPEGPAAVMVVEDVSEWRRAEEAAERRRSRLDTVMRHTPVGLATVDNEGRLSFWAAGNERLLGYSPSEVVSRPMRELLAEPEAFDALLEKACQVGSAEGDNKMKLKNGDIAPFQVSLSKLIDRDGRQVGCAVCLLDIAERVRAADEIRREQQKLNEVVNVMGAGLALIDRGHRIVWANKRLREWFGGEGGLVGRKCHEVYCHSLFSCPGCVTDQVFSGKRLAEWTGVLRTRSGAMRHFHHAASPVLGAGGEVAQVLKISQDITSQTKKVYQLSRLRQINEFMQGMLEVDELLRLILTCATAGQALGFNRSMLFLIDQKRNLVTGRMGVGPGSGEEAHHIWDGLEQQGLSLQDLLVAQAESGSGGDETLTGTAKAIRIDLLHDTHVVVRSIIEKRAIVVRDAWNDPRVPKDFAERLQAREFVVAPLISRGEVLGVIEADNLYGGRPIEDDDVDLLNMFASQAGIAIATAEAYRQVREQMGQLEGAYIELAEAQEKLLRSERLVTIGRMAAHVAHEIRNPLVTIGGFARAMLSSKDLDPKTRRRARIMAEEVTRLETILRGVMDFARPPAPNVESRSINDIARLALRVVGDRAKEKGVRMDVSLAEGLPKTLIDPTQIQQVLYNILGNALDAVDTGGRITVKTGRTDDSVWVDIHNTGSYIPPAEQANVFEPFVTNKADGTGLGLAISHKIVQDLGGSIEVVSRQSEGTAFKVYLPIRSEGEDR